MLFFLNVPNEGLKLDKNRIKKKERTNYPLIFYLIYLNQGMFSVFYYVQCALTGG
jgi:hypothetical protein